MKNFILWPTLICLCCTPLLSFGVKSQGPFFWQISKDHKSSYVLGTMHDGVNFEELQCHKEIKGHLLESDFLLTELRRTDTLSYKYGILAEEIIIDSILQNNEQTAFNSLNDDSKIFLENILEDIIVYNQYDDKLNQFTYKELYGILNRTCNRNSYEERKPKQVLIKVEPIPKPKAIREQKITTTNQNLQDIYLYDFYRRTNEPYMPYRNHLDYQILIDFLNHKQTSLPFLKLEDNDSLVSQFLSPINEDNEDKFFNTEVKPLLNELSSRIDNLIKVIDQIANSREDLASLTSQIPNPLDNIIMPVDQFISPLDDLDSLLMLPFFENSIIQKTDIQEFVQNFNERCSEDYRRKIRSARSSFNEEEVTDGGLVTTSSGKKRDFINGVINLEDDSMRDSYMALLLDAEVKIEMFHRTKYINDFRNELWRLKIIKAHERHNSFFVAGGVAHFIRQDRNPLNLNALKEYAEANKSLPTNVLDMLKEEGFTVKRMGTDCHFE